jgi:signal transduction histidine kinase
VSGRGERIIAIGRLLLALFSLVALQDRVVIAVVVYALMLALVAWRAPVIAVKYRLLLHVCDFLLYSMLVQTTHAAVSPFFVFFSFSLFSALIRFGVRGTLINAAAAILTYVTLAVLDDRIRNDSSYLVVRIASLSVVTLLLVYIGAFHERMQAEMAKLASWPRAGHGSRESLALEALSLAREALRVPRAILAWKDATEEPVVWCAVHDGTPRMTREGPAFLEKLQQQYDGRNVLATDITGDTMQGRLLFLDRTDFAADDATFADVVGRLVATRIDQLNVAERMRATAVGEERIRVARDLHDGLLQSLTGAALQLEALHRVVGVDDDAVRQRLRRVQELIENDQRELRKLITDLRPKSGEEGGVPLAVRLIDLAERFERQWDVAVSVVVEPPLPALTDERAGEIYNIVSEGVANAAKHARATRIDAAVRARDGRVEITLADNGQGFPFRGEYDLRMLDELRRGPVTLKERVASLGGELLLQSSETGATLLIRI